jgi:hypothetical protein
MRECASCRGEVEERYRFCPWCAAPLRLKVVEFFPPHPLVEGDAAKALRVSRYLAEEDERRHVRFSVWHAGEQTPRAQAAVSLTEEEAARLSAFLAARVDASEAETLV